MAIQFQGASQGEGNLLGINSSDQSFLFSTNKVKQYLNVKDFGAKGDGKLIEDAVLTISSDILISATANFSVDDVGKSISVQKASGANTVAGTILNVNSSTEIQLSFSASANQSDVTIWYGTDDTDAIQDTINYWHNSARSKKIFIPAGIYIIAGEPQRNVGGVDMFGQLYIPYESFISGKRSRCVIEGEIPALGFYAARHQVELGLPDAWRGRYGTILKSNYTTTGGALGASVIGTAGPPAAFPYDFNYHVMHIENIQIIVDAKIGGIGPVLSGINGSKSYATHIENCGVAADAGLGESQEPTISRVTTGISYGPQSDDQPNIIRNTNVSGFFIGINSGEHGLLDYVSVLGCFYGLKMNTSGYGTYVTTMQIYWCKNTIWNNSNSFYTYLDMGRLEIEHNLFGTYWYDNDYDVVDTNNQIHGIIHSISVNDSLTKNGGNNLLLLNQGQNLPDWTTATRPTQRLVPSGDFAEVKYVIGLNTDTGNVEFYNGTTWVSLSNV